MRSTRADADRSSPVNRSGKKSAFGRTSGRFPISLPKPARSRAWRSTMAGRAPGSGKSITHPSLQGTVDRARFAGAAGCLQPLLDVGHGVRLEVEARRVLVARGALNVLTRGLRLFHDAFHDVFDGLASTFLTGAADRPVVERLCLARVGTR